MRTDTSVPVQADVIAATCIGVGMRLLRDIEFPFVVVDEAAQVGTCVAHLVSVWLGLMQAARIPRGWNGCRLVRGGGWG